MSSTIWLVSCIIQIYAGSSDHLSSAVCFVPRTKLSQGKFSLAVARQKSELATTLKSSESLATFLQNLLPISPLL